MYSNIMLNDMELTIFTKERPGTRSRTSDKSSAHEMQQPSRQLSQESDLRVPLRTLAAGPHERVKMCKRV